MLEQITLKEKIRTEIRFWTPIVGIFAIIVLMIVAIKAHTNQTALQVATLQETRAVSVRQALLKSNTDQLEILKINGAKAQAILEIVQKQQESIHRVLSEHKSLSDQIITNQSNLKVDRKVVEEASRQRISEVKEISERQTEILKELRLYEDQQLKIMNDVLKQLESINKGNSGRRS